MDFTPSKTPRGIRLGASRDSVKTTKSIKRIVILETFNSKCFWCDKELCRDTATIDHLIPQSAGGSHVITNLVPSCGDCNQAKGSRMPTQHEIERSWGAHMRYRKAQWGLCSPNAEVSDRRAHGNENTTGVNGGSLH